MAPTILQFVRSTRLRSRLVHAAASLAGHGIAVGVVLAVIGWRWPQAWSTALQFGLGWLAVVALYLVLRRGLSLRQADRRLGLHDRLVTWWGLRQRAAAQDGMALWLERDLTDRLAELPETRRRVLWRRPARRLWWLLPLLLLVWIIGPLGRNWMFESEVGRTVEKQHQPRNQPTPVPGPSAGGGKPDGRAPDQAPSRPEPEPVPRPDPAQPSPPPSTTPDQPPSPIPELPALDQFVIPRFLGEGDGRKQRMKVAVVEEGGTTPPPSTAASSATTDPAATRREFAAAAERARRSRFVPERERAFVGRYFDALSGSRR